MLLARLFRAFVRRGAVTVIDPRGRRHVCDSGVPGPRAAIRIHDAATARRIITNPTLEVGEAYMDGRLTIEEGSLYSFLDVCTANLHHLLALPFYAQIEGTFRVLRRIAQFNPVDRSRRNVAHHYDLSGRLYDLFLDADRQYSCAYFTQPDRRLEDAQQDKKRHIAAKLMLDRGGLRVLDIGCGWGGLALYLAREFGAEVTGITLSEEQLKLARERAQRAGLGERVRFELRDYRDQDGTFDRIVSVGMFEHVGVPQFPAFFAKVNDLLAEGGVALLHSIGRLDGPGATNPWIRKYIFPGGYCPALSEVLPVVEKSGLLTADIEILRLHYAETLRAWRTRFAANRARAVALYDERFARMWEFYLAGSELAFRNEGQMVFQLQMTRNIATLPMTRDYIYEGKHRQGRRAETAA